MTNSNTISNAFPRLGGRAVQADFDGGDITSNAGLVLLGALDKKMALTKSVAQKLPDPRQANRCTHDTLSIVRQRVFAVAAGWEDLNDHQSLRHDTVLQNTVGVDHVLSGASTQCRFENSATREHAWAIHEVLVEKFIQSHPRPPRKLVLDFDATDDAIHGNQEGRFFHGYYDHYCFLPLYVFCGEQLLVAYLRPSRIDGAKHTGAILKLLVGRLRQQWPEVKIVFRGDCGFCRDRVLSWCTRNEVDYVVGIAKNARLKRLGQTAMEEAEQGFAETQKTTRVFAEFRYAAKKWKAPRRVIIRADHSAKGENPRFITTSLNDDAAELYETIYCARGEMENRIKEQQLDLFADRTSCHRWWPNQLRLLWSGLAYTLLERLRNDYLHGTRFSRAQSGTIRLKLLKIGAVVLRNTRRLRLHLPSAFPHREIFVTVWNRLARQ